MASAYELMLVLRGRNYLSNDLRRAGADISRLKTQAGLQNARNQLQINKNRLATTRQIAEQEALSLTSGQRHLALGKQRLSVWNQSNEAAKKLATTEKALADNQAIQTANAQKLAAVQSRLGTTHYRSSEAAQLKAAQEKLIAIDRELIAEQAKLNEQLLVAQNTMAKVAISEQQLVAVETAHAERLQVLNDRINTTNAALELNSVKLNENAMAIARQPFEKLAAGARYVEHLGRAFQTLGLVSVAALGFAAHSAAKFNTEITLASTQATLIGDRSTAKVLANTSVLQKQLQNMLVSGQTAAKPTDLTGGLYTIFSGLTLQGNQKQQLKEGLTILKEFNQVFTANFGQVDFNDVTKAGIALINNFALGVKQIPIVMNQMQASVRFGAMTMGEMTASLNQVIPAFKAAGYGTKQMFADIAFVSRLFPSLRIGTTGLARLTEMFAKYHEQISADVGTNIAPGGHLSPIATIAEEILKAHSTFIKGGVDLQNYFKTVTGFTGTVQARRVLTAFITNLKLYHTIAGQVTGDTHELTRSFRDMNQTPQVRWAEFTNQLRGLTMEIGAGAIPVFQKLAKPVENAIKWFDKLSPSTKKAVSVIATWVGVGMLFGGTALVIVGALGRMYAALRLFLIGRAGVAALEGGFISAGTALRGTLIGALILAIPLLVKYHTQVGHIVDALGGMKNVLIAVTSLIAAFKIAKLAQAIIGIAGIGTTSAVAAGEVDALTFSILGLEGALAAFVIPAALAAFIGYKIFSTPMHNLGKGSAGQQFTEVNGKVYTLNTAGRGAPALIPVAGNVALPPQDAHVILSKAAARIRGLTQGEISAEAVRRIIKAGGKPPGTNIPVPPFDVNAAIANVEKLRAISEKSPSMANYLAYEKARSALEKHFTGDSLTALQDYLNHIESAEKKSNRSRLSEAKKAAAERLQALKDAASNAMSIYDQLLGQNQSIMGSLFSGPFINSPSTQNRLQFGGRLTGSDYLKDLKSQTAQFTTFYAQIGKLQKRGAPQELINQLIQAGPQALPAIKALANMGDGQWGQYIKVFKHGQDLLHKQTMIQLTAQLKDYRKYGEKIALQIISGMRDKRLGLANEIKSIINQIFGVNVLSTHGPSKNDQSNASRVASQHRGRMPHGGTFHPHSHRVPGTGSRTVQSVTYNYNVTAPTSEHASIKTQLRHADFAAKAKYERTR